MRILVLTNLYPPHVLGGFEIACAAVVVRLRQRGHRVDVLSGQAHIATPNDPAWLHRVLALRAFDPIGPHTAEVGATKAYDAGCSQHGNTVTLLAYLQRIRPDIVYVWNVYGVGGLALLDLLDLVGIPWVMHLMDIVPTLLFDGIRPSVAGLFARPEGDLFNAAHAIAMSEHVVAEIVATTPVRFDTYPTIIPGWVDAHGLPQRTRYREGGVLRLVAAGALGEHKGTDLIIRACARLVADGHADFEVDVFGFGPVERWVALASQLGVADHVRFHGGRSHAEILSLLPQYDAFLFPTQYREPFGFAPVEAAACGAVPIVTRNAGVAERLVDGVHALKIDRTAESLADAIGQLLSGEVDVECLGRRAARMVRTDLSFDRCMDKIERALHATVRPWDPHRLDDPRHPVLLYAKHLLGQHLTANR